MLTATIVRLPSGRIYVRIGPAADDGGENAEVLETLNGFDRDELKERAKRFVEERLGRRVG